MLNHKNRMRKLLFLFAMLNYQIQARILIITAAYNRPDLIELQYRCLNKFVQEDFDLVVFNDAEDDQFRQQIESECKKFNIRHILVDQKKVHKNHHIGVAGWEDVFNFKSKNGDKYVYRVNFRSGEVIQHAFELLGFKHDDIVVNTDLDCFPIRPISIRAKMKNKLIAGYRWDHGAIKGQGLLPILMAFDMPKLPHKEVINFNSGFIGSKWTDLCSLLQFYTYCHDLEVEDWCSLGHLRCSNLGKNYSKEELIDQGYSETTIDFVKQYYQKLFLELGYVQDDMSQIINTNKAKKVFDLGQIIDKDYFHFNQCTNWMGAYDDTFIKAKSKLVREFVLSITK
jgi:hypothetical protein